MLDKLYEYYQHLPAHYHLMIGGGLAILLLALLDGAYCWLRRRRLGSPSDVLGLEPDTKPAAGLSGVARAVIQQLEENADAEALSVRAVRAGGIRVELDPCSLFFSKPYPGEGGPDPGVVASIMAGAVEMRGSLTDVEVFAIGAAAERLYQRLQLETYNELEAVGAQSPGDGSDLLEQRLAAVESQVRSIKNSIHLDHCGADTVSKRLDRLERHQDDLKGVGCASRLGRLEEYMAVLSESAAACQQALKLLEDCVNMGNTLAGRLLTLERHTADLWDAINILRVGSSQAAIDSLLERLNKLEAEQKGLEALTRRHDVLTSSVAKLEVRVNGGAITPDPDGSLRVEDRRCDNCRLSHKFL